jgi:hypothetical protein
MASDVANFYQKENAQMFVAEDGHKRAGKSRREQWETQRSELITKDLLLNHSANIIQTSWYNLTDKVFSNLRKKMLKADPFLMQRPHFETLEVLKKSDLFKCF